MERWVLSGTKIGKFCEPETGASEEKVTLMNVSVMNESHLHGSACLQWLEKPAFSPHRLVYTLANVC